MISKSSFPTINDQRQRTPTINERNELYIRTQLGVVRLSHPLATPRDQLELDPSDDRILLITAPVSHVTRSTSQHCQFHLHHNRIPPEMSNRSSQPAEPTLQPFRLFDLPQELLVPIVRSYRTQIRVEITESDGLVIHRGEISNVRYRTLMDLCLTHRDILPFAQEELFKRLDIVSADRLDKLNMSIASSERCRGYAGRAESIRFVGRADKLMESGAFNAHELFCAPSIKVSILSTSYLFMSPHQH